MLLSLKNKKHIYRFHIFAAIHWLYFHFLDSSLVSFSLLCSKKAWIFRHKTYVIEVRYIIYRFHIMSHTAHFFAAIHRLYSHFLDSSLVTFSLLCSDLNIKLMLLSYWSQRIYRFHMVSHNFHFFDIIYWLYFHFLDSSLVSFLLL